MIEFLIDISRYLYIGFIIGFFMISLIILYRQMKKTNEYIVTLYHVQRGIIFLHHTIGFIILIAVKESKIDYVVLFVEEILLFVFVWFIVEIVYNKTNLLLWNLVIFLTSIGFLVLARLDFVVAKRQMIMGLFAFFILIMAPIIIKMIKFWDKLTILYGILILVLLLLPNSRQYGANNWFEIGNFSFQPSEIVKTIYLFFFASLFSKKLDVGRIIIIGFTSFCMISILVYQKDLGAALIFYALFLSMLYIVTDQILFVIGGLFAGGLGAYGAYFLFDHIKVRVEAFINPWANIDTMGYQITQSLFAISNGGVIGTGLTRGNPKDIPVVIADFVFSAISEEFGNLYGIFLILVYMVLFLCVIQIGKQTKEYFHFLLINGAGILLAFQAILILGGATKLFPITGVTLPFISAGGSSLISMIIIIAVIQGISLKDAKK